MKDLIPGPGLGLTAITSIALLGLVLGGCSERAANGTAGGNGVATVTVDGSSTVYPITEAVAEELGKGGRFRVTVGVSGTGGGLKKLCNREVAVAGASRPIRAAELEACARTGVEVIELPVAYDGIAVVVNPQNTWVSSMTVAELRALWAPEAQGKIMKWSQLRPGWPDQEIHLFGAGVDSGTYDYFTEAVVGKEHASRGDFTSSEDDNVLVQGVAGDPLALGFFGLAYQEQNASRLKLVAIDDGKPENGAGPVLPSPSTVRDGTYQPLSRPLFLYVARDAAERPEVQAFVSSYLHDGPRLVAEVGYVPLPTEGYALVEKRFERRVTGSVFEGGGSRVGVTVLELLRVGSGAAG